MCVNALLFYEYNVITPRIYPNNFQVVVMYDFLFKQT